VADTVMSPAQLKAVFRRILMGAAAPALLSDCGPPCSSPQTVTTVLLADGGADCSACATGICTVVDGGPTPLVSCGVVCKGRAPAGTIETDLSELNGIGGYLARMAHFEAASVEAFNQLARELVSIAAPARLVEQALQAAHDEVVHAETVSKLARRRGTTPPVPRITMAPRRSIDQLAIDNAAEGCVREAFGALVGLYQSAHAAADDVRIAMAQVAEDEVAHASFSFELALHLNERIGSATRAKVREARDEAVAELLHQAFAADDVPFRDELGLPPADVLFELARGFQKTLPS
jgi:hypothetical protein